MSGFTIDIDDKAYVYLEPSEQPGSYQLLVSMAPNGDSAEVMLSRGQAIRLIEVIEQMLGGKATESMVYVVERGGDDMYEPLIQYGIFSTRENAKEYIKIHNYAKELKDEKSDILNAADNLFEIEVDKPFRD